VLYIVAPYRNYTEYLRIPSLGSSCGPLIPWKRCLRRLSIWWREGRRACGRSKSTKPTSTQECGRAQLLLPNACGVRATILT
jgi:hypothetical protein